MFGGFLGGGGEGRGLGGAGRWCFRARDSGASTDVTQVTFKDQALLEQMKEKACEDLTVQITYK